MDTAEAVELKDKLNEALRTDPVVFGVLLSVTLLALLAAVALTVLLVSLKKKGRLSFNLVPPLRLPLWGQALAYAALALLCYSLQSGNASDWAMLLQLLVAPACLIVVAVAGAGWAAQYGMHRLSYFTLPLLALLILFASFTFIQPIGILSNALIEALGFKIELQSPVNKLFEIDDPDRLANLLFLAVVIAPVVEEIVFRGFLHPLLKSTLPTWLAIVLTSLVFAAFHFHAPVFAQLFVLAVIMSLAYEFTGSLGLCILIHMFFNAFQAALALFMRFWILT